MFFGKPGLALILFFLLKTGAFAQSFEVWNVPWKHLGPHSNPVPSADPGEISSHGMGWVESLAVFEKDKRYMYAGSNTGGIYCTENGGRNWRNISPPGRISGVRDIVIDDEDPHKVWIATGTGFPVVEQAFGNGVLFSANGGKSWQKTGLSMGGEGGSMQFWQLVRSKSDPDLFFAASDTRIYRSVDGCRTFNQVYIGSDGLFFRHLLVHPNNPDYVVCAGSKLMVSTDRGETWKDITSSLSFNFRQDGGGPPERIALAMHPGYDFGLFALYRSGQRNFIDESADWGSQWINVNVNRDLIRVDRNHAELVALSKDEVITGSVRLCKVNVVTDQVDLLTQPAMGAANFAHDDIRDIQLTNDGHLYIATDGGVSVSTDTGKTWKDLSGQGLAITQVYGIDVHPSYPGYIVIGCQDLGNLFFDGQEWHHISSIYGDGGEVRFVGENMLLIMQNGRMMTTKDTGRTRQWLNQPFYADRFTYPLDIRETDSGIIVTAADKYIWNRDVRGKWTKISSDNEVANAKKSAMDINMSEPRSIFFANWEPTWGTGDLLRNRLYRSVYEKDTFYWEDITYKLGILAWGSVSGLVSDPENPNRIWLSLYRYDGDNDPKPYKVFYSADRGETWINYSDGFPNYGIYCIRYLPGTDGGVIVGTDGGVFYRDQAMNNWVQFGGAMPGIMIKDMVFDPETRFLTVGTHGNGVWRAKLPKSLFR